jgi:bifunctional UDP-N-acetylglucosamine pyrophosphorylase/glucosamine-1-phosphate N-acetyltransferase
MIQHLLATVASLDPERTVVVVGPDMHDVKAAVAPLPSVVQAKPLGTGDAVKAATDALPELSSTVLILYGDSPLISAETLGRMLAARATATKPAVVVLGFCPRDPGDYGRLIVSADGALEAVVEARDAGKTELAIPLCNSGVMAIDGVLLPELLARVGNDNAKGEIYLTDIVALARSDGRACAVIEGDERELLGINSRADLAVAEAVVQTEYRARAMAAGATLIDPSTVWFSYDTQLGRDVVVHPNVVFGPGVHVDDGAEIKSFSHLEGTHVGKRALIGPFARLRPGTKIGPEARVGNFVETKNTTLGSGAKANHLTYLGDAEIGARANIGAGTITCNYDGFTKQKTKIGSDANIGSNTSLVAPVKIGAGAIIGAGSTITRDVDEQALALTRAPQEEKPDFAPGYQARKTANKKGAKR